MLGGQRFADFPIQHVMRVLVIAPEEGEVEHAHPLIEVVVDRRAADVHRRAGAELHAFDDSALFA